MAQRHVDHERRSMGTFSPYTIACGQWLTRQNPPEKDIQTCTREVDEALR